MLTKSRVTVAVSVLAIVAAGGSVVAARELSTGPDRTMSVGLPAPAGSLATARVPSGASSSDGTASSGADGTGSGLGSQPGNGSGGTASSGTGSSGQAAQLQPLTAADGQGEKGPLPTGALPADGAVPGATASLHALAAARASITRLPHSPQLLAALDGTASSGAPANTAAGAPANTAAGATSGGTSGASEPAAASPTPTPGTSALPGLDVAAFQHPDTSQYPGGTPINWSQVAAAGYRFVAVKGTEGDYYVNPWGTSDLAEAKAAGLDITAYHFAIPNVSGGAEQAQFAVEYSGYATGPGMLPLMLDIEYDPYVASDHTNECYGLSPAKMTAWIAAFVNTARALTGQYPVIYTTAGWWNACTGGSTAFAADPMWVAAYGFTSPPMPDGWASYTFWQYTSGGTVPGVQPSGGIDLDSFNPQVVGLIDPGIQASREWARVSLPVGSLGALAGEHLSWTESGLPPGLGLSGGVISGTVRGTSSPLLRPPYLVTLTVRNSSGATATVAFSWTVGSSCIRYPTSAICLDSP